MVCILISRMFKNKNFLDFTNSFTDSEIKSASSINVVIPENKSSSSETFETPPEDNPFPENDISISRKNSITEENPVPEHNFVFSDNDDDNLFEELTNKALQINAVKDRYVLIRNTEMLVYKIKKKSNNFFRNTNKNFMKL